MASVVPAQVVAFARPENRDGAASGRSARPKPRLRVGLVTDSRLQPRWLVKAFADVAACEFVDIAVIADFDARPRNGPALWRAYCALDQRLFGKGDDPTALCDLAAAVRHGRYIKLRTAGVSAALPACREALAGLGLDVVFALGEICLEDPEPLARYGVWRFGFGADAAAPLEAAGLPEQGQDLPVAASGLLARMPGEACERVVCQSWSRTFPLSVARSRRGLLPKTSGLPRLALKRLHDAGPDWIGACESLPGSDQPRSALHKAGGYLRHLAGAGAYVAGRTLQSLLFVDQWFLAYRFGNAQALGTGAIGDLRNFQVVMPPKDRFWADPFPIEHGGRHYIFFEELLFAKGRAHISAMEVDSAGRCSRPVTVLQRDYHLSYPFLVEDRGQLYMVPETGKNGTVEVYRCVSFPDRWKLEKVLLHDVCSADATFHHAEDGRWWMFVSLFPRESQFIAGGDELHIFHADDFLGPWTPHAGNPVNSDVRNARPAGRLFTRDGVLYRPSQIGVPIYGSGISINQVLRLSPTEFIEKEVEKIHPQHPKGVLGIHTLNSTARLTVIDAFNFSPKLWHGGPTWQ